MFNATTEKYCYIKKAFITHKAWTIFFYVHLVEVEIKFDQIASNQPQCLKVNSQNLSIILHCAVSTNAEKSDKLAKFCCAMNIFSMHRYIFPIISHLTVTWITYSKVKMLYKKVFKYWLRRNRLDSMRTGNVVTSCLCCLPKNWGRTITTDVY